MKSYVWVATTVIFMVGFFCCWVDRDRLERRLNMPYPDAQPPASGVAAPMEELEIGPDLASALVDDLEVQFQADSGDEWVGSSFSCFHVDDPSYKWVYGFRDGWRIEIRDPNCVVDDSIKSLCKSGRICGVMGHQWRYDPRPAGYIYREACGLCGAERSPSMVEVRW